MSTDPMRNALERIAYGRARLSGTPGEDFYAAQSIAREALAGHPDDQHVRIPRWAAEEAVAIFEFVRNDYGTLEDNEVRSLSAFRAALADHNKENNEK